MTTIDTARLRELFNYDPETGVLTHRAGRRAGLPAGCIDKSKRGYVRISIPTGNGRYLLLYAHRLVWQYVHGSEPALDLDHINGVRSDNRISNLREVSRSQNQWNYPTPKTNTSGAKGVRATTSGRWAAYIKQYGERIYLGTFVTIEQASAAYRDAEARLFGEFARPETANDNEPLPLAV
ncbi:hypothetical protein QkW1_62 [Ralstonia phage QkW1]